MRNKNFLIYESTFLKSHLSLLSVASSHFQGLSEFNKKLPFKVLAAARIAYSALFCYSISMNFPHLKADCSLIDPLADICS